MAAAAAFSALNKSSTLLKNTCPANNEAALTDPICRGRFSLSLRLTFTEIPKFQCHYVLFQNSIRHTRGPSKQTTKNVLPWFTMHQAATRVTGSPESSFEVCMSQQSDSKAQYAITRHSRAASAFLLLYISFSCLQYISFISPSGSVKASYTLLICWSGLFILQKIN